jgi:hypothetical protein
MPESQTCTAFAGPTLIASGDLAHVALAVKKQLEKHPLQVLIFDDTTGEPVEVDLRGTIADVARRLTRPAETAPAQPEPRGPGRPKLGVTAREVTLLPRHWEWLNAQPGGASVALRKLVEDARKVYAGRDRMRQAQEVTYRFMAAMTGNLGGYEEAMRALYAGDRDRFTRLLESWPPDIRTHIARLSAAAFPDSAPEPSH